MSETFTPVAPHWWVTNLGGLVVNGVVAARTGSRLLQATFAGGVALHVGEAVYAYARARRAGLEADAPRWALQTLGVGFPSLRALHTLIADREVAPA